ncbi:MAG: ClpX C4-type zinc finger protein [Methylocella sp.]
MNDDSVTITEQLIFEFLQNHVLPAMRAGRHDEVLRNALLAYLMCASDFDRARLSALVLLDAASKALRLHLTKDNEPPRQVKEECSFCGLRPPEVTLGAGPNAFICNRCVSTFAEVFQTK